MKKIKFFFYIIVLFALCYSAAGTVTAASISAPSYVNAFVYSSGSIRINWDNTVSGASGYTIQRKTDSSGSFVTVANVSASSSTYNDTNISNGHIYIYRVYATSGIVSGTAAESFPVEYLYPVGLTINSISDSELELAWTYPYLNKIPESNYQTVIERRRDGSSTWQAVVTVPGNQRTFTDTGLLECNRYYYRIRALTSTSALYLYYPNNSTGQNASTLLKSPTQVKAEIQSDTSIKITWEDNSQKETGYRIERKTGNGSFSYLSTVSANATSYTDNSPVNGEQYTYRVIAVSSSLSGMPSSEITVPFLFPVSFSIENAYSTQMTLIWSYPGSGYITPDNSRVLIERRETGLTYWEHIHTTRPGETEYTDSGLNPGTRYFYRIRSCYSDSFTTDYFPSASGISEYTRLMLDTFFYGYALSDTEILLEWDRDAVGSLTVHLEKLADNGSYEILTTLIRQGSYIDTVTPGSTNTYRMKVRSTYFDSDYTPEIDVTAETLPAVNNFIIRSVMPQRIFMTWEYEKSLETGFEIWRLTDSEGVWTHIGSTGRGQCMYSDDTVKNGETYHYRIRAKKNDTIFSTFSLPQTVKMSFSEPDGLLVVSKSENYLYLGWEDFSDFEQYYVIEYKTHINDVWRIKEKLPKNICIYRFVPEVDVDYTLRVRAYSDYPVYESVSNECFYTTKVSATPSLMLPSIVGSNRVVLKWVDLSDNEDEFVIYRKNNAFEDEFRIIGNSGENTTTFADATVYPGQEYTFIVKSKNAAGESFESNKIIINTPIKTQFGDLGNHPWAKDAIESLTSMGIVDGDGKGNYNPSGNITRAEFIKLLAATFSLTETPYGSFKDVTYNDWYHRWIMTAYRSGIVEPDEDGLFHPETPISRQDIVFYSVRAIKAAGFTLEQPPLYLMYGFSDYNEISPYAQSSFAAMNHAGIINGIGNNRLGPLNPATRAEAATILYRMIKVLEKQGY